MTRRFSYIITFAFCSIQVSGQEKGVISPDSLLTLFKMRPSFDVLLNAHVYNLTDFKKAYDNEQLKQYLLKWLSKEEYRDYIIQRDIKRFSDNTENIKKAIEYRLLKQNRGSYFDSIVNNPCLYLKYRDSVVTDELAMYRSVRKTDGYYPPSQALWWHTKIPYPESYRIIRQWWDESGKLVFDANKKFNEYFLALVKMGDPEARGLFTIEIDKFISTNGQSLFYGDLNSILLNIKNSYGISKMLELLKVGQKFQWISDGNDPETPFNCEMRLNLMFEFAAHSIQTDPCLKADASCDRQLKFIRQINEAGQKLITKYLGEEKYWMENMPFYKN